MYLTWIIYYSPIQSLIKILLITGFLIPPYCLKQSELVILDPVQIEKINLSHDFFYVSETGSMKDTVCQLCGFYFITKKGESKYKVYYYCST